MFRLLRILILVSACSFFRIAATHAQAGPVVDASLTYEWLADSTYRLHVWLQGPCDSPVLAVPQVGSLSYAGGCNAATGKVSVFLQAPSVLHPSVYHYQGTFTVPVRCGHYTFYTSVPGRRSAVNLDTVKPGPVYIAAALNADTAGWGLSSPRFKTPFDPWYWSGYTVDAHATDPDGDSLAYDEVPLLTVPPSFDTGQAWFSPQVQGVPLAYKLFPPYVGGIWGPAWTLDPWNGTIALWGFPAADGENAVAYRVRKYHNGVFVGSVTREGSLHVLPIPTSTGTSQPLYPTAVSGSSSPPGSLYLQTAVDSALQFCIEPSVSGCAGCTIQGIDATNAQQIYQNPQLSYAGFGSNTVKICVRTTPFTALQTGPVAMVFMVRMTSPEPLCYVDTVSFPVRVTLVIDSLSQPAGVGLPGAGIVRAYPNPVGDLLHTAGSDAHHLVLAGMDGTIVAASGCGHPLDVRLLADGMYLLRVYDAGNRLLLVQKISKQAP